MNRFVGRQYFAGKTAGKYSRPTGNSRPGSSGFTLVSAIFLMVVLVVLGASLVTLGSVQHTTSAQQLQSVRAYYAARTGVEWAVARASTGCPAGTLEPLGGTLASFTVTVTCTSSNHDLGGVVTPYHMVEVTATSGNYEGTDYVSRRVQAKLMGGP